MHAAVVIEDKGKPIGRLLIRGGVSKYAVNNCHPKPHKVLSVLSHFAVTITLKSIKNYKSSKTEVIRNRSWNCRKRHSELQERSIICSSSMCKVSVITSLGMWQSLTLSPILRIFTHSNVRILLIHMERKGMKKTTACCKGIYESSFSISVSMLGQRYN